MMKGAFRIPHGKTSVKVSRNFTARSTTASFSTRPNQRITLQSNKRSTTLNKAPSLINRNTTQKRTLYLHEYQSQGVMKTFGITVPEGSPAKTAEEAEKAAIELLRSSPKVAVKAQILAGGRALGTFDNGFKGGVHFCSTPKEVREVSQQMLGRRLITKQTGPAGKPVNTVLITKEEKIKRETYLAMLLDRAYQGPILMASARGGVSIEKVAEEDPKAIIKEPFDLDIGPSEQQTLKIAQAIGFPEKLVPEVQRQINNIYKMFVSKDCLLVELNPFIETDDGRVVCLDAKVNFDDNAHFRQPDLFKMEDLSQKDPREQLASKYDLNYIGLEGNIGCLVNGAGLAMATMDIIKLHGAAPANFLDVGGGATKKQILEAIKIISNDPSVKAILINIFGGIMRCDIVAEGLVEAAKEINLSIPLVVRLAGTNMDKANEIMKNSGLKIIPAMDLDDAAAKAVASLKQN